MTYGDAVDLGADAADGGGAVANLAGGQSLSASRNNVVDSNSSAAVATDRVNRWCESSEGYGDDGSLEDKLVAGHESQNSVGRLTKEDIILDLG